ncbi:gamma-glutamyltranspeptidase [Auriculariales sp. MPI-PUGE-AT-0066]|nr:gamma-glutamyltranspeptidase [Auriculariales sp. MPI-PUGE-AT-0066]
MSLIDWDKVNKPELPLQPFASRRSIVYGTKGVVACSQPLAAEAGLEILRKGGNACDAAVAVSAALNVTEPSCCGIGGDAFCLFYDAKEKQVKALNGSGRSPAALTIEHIRAQGITGRDIPLTNLNSVTVPGAAAAWVDAVAAFGGGKLSIADVLEPAIRLAEEGVPVSEINSYSWQRSEKLIKTASPDGHAMLLNGRAPRPGEVMKFPDLASTFRSVAENGKDGFYRGRIAQAIVDLIKSGGGLMELSDLEAHSSSLVEPIKYTFADEVTVYECPPNGQGITALLALGILDALQERKVIKPLGEMEHNSVEYLHVLVESLRLAFADSRYYVTDPDVEHVPVKELLSKEYLKKRSELFNPTKAAVDVSHGSPVHSSDTVYFTASDQWGNACSFIQSNYAGFGTAAIPHGCGFTLQNRGSGFILEEGHPNQLKASLSPARIILHTFSCSHVLRGTSGPFLSYGVMGGFMQPQGHVQVLLNVLRGFGPQASLDAPRFCISAGLPDAQAQGSARAGDINAEVFFEEGIPLETVAKLKEMGHDAHTMSGPGRGLFGRGQIIQKLHDTLDGRLVWAAGSDPRIDGHAVAQI